MLFLTLLTLFWTPHLWLGVILAFIFYFITIIVDNVFPRLTWPFMLKFVWTVGLILILGNLIALAILGVI
ncbi:MAG: hypothetical protein DRO46_01390 [Candidatus Hecatellales archaeon]|nr:MAG: hypothetical protein DRO46_01390 [Candidatus Hecatellales archaeon]